MGAARVIVGLGNPGREYEGTRHNVGFEVVDRLAARLESATGTVRWKSDFQGVVGDLRLKGGRSGDGEETRLLLVKPQTFMNLSGACVQPLLAFYKIALKDLLVVVDEINLAVGDVRLRQTGSHGGHNGLRDLQARLGTADYPRLRIGVDKPAGGGSQVGHVLGKFAAADQDALEGGLKDAVEAADRFAYGGFSAAQKWWSQVCQERETAERKERLRLETERRHAAEAARKKDSDQSAHPPASRPDGAADAN